MTSLALDSAPTRPLAVARRHAPLASLLALAALLYLYGLSRSGYANDFYAAAVKAGTQSWKAFLFGSLDPSNFITVDKPPASLWLMELSSRAFGFSSFTMLLPQALEGVASVWLLSSAVKRSFGPAAGLLSGLVLAATPVAALMFRFNNPDALLVLTCVAAAYATVRAIERGSWRWLALAGVLVGFGFLTKMLEAFLVVPALALAYAVARPRQVYHLLAGGAGVVLGAGWWVTIVALTPAADRPFVGGSTNDSIFDLIWGYNGVERINGTTGPGGGGGAGFGGTAGIFRLFNSEFGGQISWLLPAAVVALVAGAVLAVRHGRLRAPLVLWGGWLVAAAGTFSLMTGIIHPYYSNLLAPPIAVLVGVGVVEAWRRRASLVARCIAGGMVATTSVWSYALLDRTPSWHPLLRDAVIVTGLLFALAFVALGDTGGRRIAAAFAALALVGGLAGSVAYTLSTVTTSETGTIVSAGPVSSGGLGGSGPGGGNESADTSLAALLEASSGSYRWAAATSSSMNAAPLELATGRAVMAIGGFNGSDNAITLAQFERLVAQKEIHYYIAGGSGFAAGRGGGFGSGSGIESWVAQHFTAQTVGDTTVYDLTTSA